MAQPIEDATPDPIYSLAHLTLINCTPAELIYIAARAGYDAVSPRFIPMNLETESHEPPLSNAQLQATRTALSTTGLEVLDIELARITDDCDPKSFEPAIAFGGEVGAKHMIMSAWTTRRDDRNFILDVYAETCDLAAPFGLTVDLEFPSFSRLRTLDEVLDIVRGADRPNGGILVDTLYLHLSRVDLGELLHVRSEAELLQKQVYYPCKLEYHPHPDRSRKEKTSLVLCCTLQKSQLHPHLRI